MKILTQYQNMSFHTLQVCEKYLDDSYSIFIFPGVWVKVVVEESVILLILTWTPTTAHWLHEIRKKTHNQQTKNKPKPLITLRRRRYPKHIERQ